MSSYCKLVLRLAELFERFAIIKITGEDNSQAGSLAKLAASLYPSLEPSVRVGF